MKSHPSRPINCSVGLGRCTAAFCSRVAPAAPTAPCTQESFVINIPKRTSGVQQQQRPHKALPCHIEPVPGTHRPLPRKATVTSRILCAPSLCIYELPLVTDLHGSSFRDQNNPSFCLHRELLFQNPERGGTATANTSHGQRTLSDSSGLLDNRNALCNPL